MWFLFHSIMLPLWGTLIGSAAVFFVKPRENADKKLMGFAGGIMLAASVWSLILPALDRSDNLGRLRFLPAIAGIWCGYLFLTILERYWPEPESYSSDMSCFTYKREQMILTGVTIHNLPEGMAVGAAVAGFLLDTVSAGALLSLACGIALQNIPEGAIVSMPLSIHKGRWKAFVYGVLSGVIEPIGALLTVLLAAEMIPILPFLLCFAAGAMIHVVVETLIPDVMGGTSSLADKFTLPLGFAVMMALDVAFS